MLSFNYADAPVSIRPDLAAAHRRYWTRLATPGSWWNGAQRVAIAQEVRNANQCALCTQRKAALSPYGARGDSGKHASNTTLDRLAIDAVHRIITDQARITASYVNDNAANGLSKPAYVELAGIAVAVLSIDEFHRALGLPLEPLPSPAPGQPSAYLPAQAVDGTGFVPMLPRDGATGNEADLWAPGRAPNVLRAFSLVPDAVRDWVSLSGAQYLSFAGMGNFVQDDARVINRMQMELIAGRVSAINECFY